MRQQARQYSAINSTSLVPSDTSRPSSAAGARLDGENKRPWTAYETTGVTHTTSQVSRDQGAAGDSGIVTSSKYISMEEHVSKNRPPSGTREMRVQSAIDLKTLESQRKKQTNVNLQSANATFNSFIDDHGQQWQNDLAMAYSQVTGVVPQNYHTPSQSSKQYQILQQQTQLKQQSKVLLEQSKAKHQAMIAQAHAVQKSLTRPESENTMVQMYAPKPPIKPGSRKATSSHHRMPRRTVPEETSLNFQFYSSNKAMIAQAHAVQKSLTRPESENTMVQMYAPKPPIKPGSRKATSSHHRMPRRTVPEETSLNFQFYSSNKPAMNGESG